MANPTTVQGWLALGPIVGLPAKNFVPPSLQSQCASVAQRNIPGGVPKSKYAYYIAQSTAQLIARGLFYAKQSWGDCGRSTPIQVSDATINEQQGASIAVGIASMAGASLPGIGPFVQDIIGIFGAHHAQAVQKEQSTLCAVTGNINQLFAYYDGLVRSGKISPSDAYKGLQTYLAQIAEQLQTIEQNCNAACYYQGFINAHSDFVQIYYPQLAPKGIFSAGPGGAPSGLGSIPGGVLTVGEGIASYPLEAIGVKVSPLNALLAILALLGLFFAIVWAVKK